ncbi:hypothetical protein M8818_002203 [Zalaria obscura]|uniref:Uncharacterized protein n=1 Tax=Zalaria obscura TaxID=2024903 RepID=A0ACC3SI77_9PEZI
MSMSERSAEYDPLLHLRGGASSSNMKRYRPALLLMVVRSRKPTKASRAAEAQIRLQRLEDMVATLVQGPQRNSADTTPSKGLPTPDSLQTTEPSPAGHLEVHGTETSYIGPTHWTTVMENIRDIRAALTSEELEDHEPLPTPPPDDSDILIRALPITASSVYASVPPRPACDKLLFNFFNGNQQAYLPFIHSGKFAREYSAFWPNPSSQSLLWVSMLFSMLSIGSLNLVHFPNHPSTNSPAPDELSSASLLASARRALVAGQYQKALPYSVEAVLLHAFTKFVSTRDLDTDAWLHFGIAARLAMKQGYHRDPSQFPSITPFEGEMRRRVFYIAGTLDLQLSFQAGLPSIFHEEECDTEFPRNLLDSDFDESSAILPPGRGLTDATPMLYYCYKGRLVRVLRRAIRQSLYLTHTVYADTMRLDRELWTVHADLPPSLRHKPLAEAFADEPFLILHRLYIHLVFQQTRIVLHRRYLSHARSDPAYAYSRSSCVDAAMAVLGLQAEFHAACRPGGMWCGRCNMSSLTLHHFLLAAMVVCLELYEAQKETLACETSGAEGAVEEGSRRARQGQGRVPEEVVARHQMHDALRLALESWEERSAESKDARRASAVLRTVLSKVPRPDLPLTQESQGARDTTQALSDNGALLSESGMMDPAWTIPPTSTANANAQDADAASWATGTSLEATDPLNTLFGDASDIDWTQVDQWLLRDNADQPMDWDFLNASAVQF